MIDNPLVPIGPHATPRRHVALASLAGANPLLTMLAAAAMGLLAAFVLAACSPGEAVRQDGAEAPPERAAPRAAPTPHSAGAGAGRNGSSSAPRTVRVASWNFGWLAASPATPEQIGACDALRRELLGAADLQRKPMDRARMLESNPRWRASPCSRPLRTADDLDALAEVARLVDADLVAVQEVESAAPLERIFGPGYAIHVTAQPDSVQRTGLAWRRSLAGHGWSVRPLPDFEDVALPIGEGRATRRLRSAAQLELGGPDGQRIRILSVHLKSACPRGRPSGGASDAQSCEAVREQLHVLNQKWMRTLQPGEVGLLVGDFNTQFVEWRKVSERTARGGDRMVEAFCSNGGSDCSRKDVRAAYLLPSWQQLTGGLPAYASTADIRPSRPCDRNCPASDADLALLRPGVCHWSIPAGRRAAYIDHVLVALPAGTGHPAPSSVVLRDTHFEWSYEDRRWNRHYRTENDSFALSDHCPVRVDVRL